MEGVIGESNGSLVAEPSEEVKFGETVFVKLHEASWWPAQVVNENSVSSATKPSSKGSSNDVLVRLYGSYIYKYVDINRSRGEFKDILIKNDFDHEDILKKSLEQDFPSLKSSRSRKGEESKSKGSAGRVGRENRSDAVAQAQVKVKVVSSKKQKQMTPAGSESKSHPNIELSGRRMKVMQSLGLVAPSGSPFPRNPTTTTTTTNSF